MTTKTKNIVKSVAFILVALFAVAMTCAYMGVFDRGGDLSVYNEDNLFNVEEYVIKTEEDVNGINVDVNRIGQIKLEGENELAEEASFVVQAIELEAGEYTISAISNEASAKTFGLRVTGLSEELNVYNVSETFELTEATTLTFTIVVEAGQEINVRISPVLVEGDKAGTFFVK